MKLEIQNLSCGYGSNTIMRSISFAVQSGEFLCLLGPNGVGKTTLFNTILGLLKLQAGKILLDGEDVSKWSRKYFATKIGYVPQAHTPPFPFKVVDVIAMGRIAHLSVFSSPSSKDIELAEKALDTLSISYLKDSIYTEISGGERQLVLIARALVQEPDFLIMDEPTSNLDFGNQIRVLNYIKKLVNESGIGVIMTTHYPNHALLYGSKVATIGKNSSFAIGNPEKVITEKYLKDTYDVCTEFINAQLNNGSEQRVCIPS